MIRPTITELAARAGISPAAMSLMSAAEFVEARDRFRYAVGEINTEPPPPAAPTEPALPVDADEEAWAESVCAKCGAKMGDHLVSYGSQGMQCPDDGVCIASDSGAGGNGMPVRCDMIACETVDGDEFCARHAREARRARTEDCEYSPAERRQAIEEMIGEDRLDR